MDVAAARIKSRLGKRQAYEPAEGMQCLRPKMSSARPPPPVAFAKIPLEVPPSVRLSRQLHVWSRQLQDAPIHSTSNIGLQRVNCGPDWSLYVDDVRNSR